MCMHLLRGTSPYNVKSLASRCNKGLNKWAGSRLVPVPGRFPNTDHDAMPIRRMPPVENIESITIQPVRRPSPCAMDPEYGVLGGCGGAGGTAGGDGGGDGGGGGGRDGDGGGGGGRDGGGRPGVGGAM